MYDDDRDALAAEYVLGTLSADERDQAEALLVIDAGFADTVRLWERRLGELNVMVEAVEPAPDLWDRIKAEIEGAQQTAEAEAVPPESQPSEAPTALDAPPLGAVEASPEIEPAPVADEVPPPPPPEPADELPALFAPPAEDAQASSPEEADDNEAVAALASSLLPPEPAAEAEKPAIPVSRPIPPEAGARRSGEVIDIERRLRRWRGLTAAVGAIAALLALYIGISQLAPGLLPAGPPPSPKIVAAAPSASGPRLVGVLQQEPTAPAFLLTADIQRHTLTVRRITEAPGAGRSYELWVIGKNAKPKSLGLVAGEFTTRPLPADLDASALQSASYAVSLEPAAGSPSGAPTGPILFTGKLVETSPHSPPAKS